MIEQEMKNCKDCIAYERCRSGQRNPITRICYSDKYFAQEYEKDRPIIEQIVVDIGGKEQ